jgi:hypothetical protein
MEQANKDKNAIWLDEVEMEVLGGYLAELLDETLPQYDREVIENVYKQTIEE